jgi:DNA-binding transcriptional MerR regulator
MYTVKQLSDLAGVSVRTLHYYDEIGLLRPAGVRANGYRAYAQAELLRLQQILFYRELGVELATIKTLLDQPEFDALQTLETHRATMQEKLERVQTLLHTLNQTIAHLKGETHMTEKGLFEGFTPEKQKEYERRVRLQYDPKLVNESIRRWASHPKVQQEAIMQEGWAIYRTIAAAIDAGDAAHSEPVQRALEQWHQHTHYFYEPTLEILRGLGTLYNTDPEFMANFQKIHPGLPAFLEQAITHYVDQLETAEIERMLAEDDADRAHHT